MTNRTITSDRPTMTRTLGGADYVNGVATVDDATPAGRSAIAFAKRRGWTVSGQPAPTRISVEDGLPLADWNTAELDNYLDEKHIGYPDTATDDDKRALIKDDFATKSISGGPVPNESAGRTSGVIGTPSQPLITNPDRPDTPAVADLYSPPLTGGMGEWRDPELSTQPEDATVDEGAAATFTVVATGEPAVTYAWERQTRGAGRYVKVEGADEATLTVPAVTAEENGGDRYRVVVSNEKGSTTSGSATLTVAAV